MWSGNFTPFFKGNRLILLSHGNTLTKCCISFVILANPVTAVVNHGSDSFIIPSLDSRGSGNDGG